MTKLQREREQAIQAYQAQEPVAAIARRLGRSRAWVHKWIKRYQATGGGEAGLAEHSRRPRGNARQTSEEIVRAVQLTRQQLAGQGGFRGAQIIRWELEDLGLTPLPSESTINRILRREGLCERRTEGYVPKGKPYPKLLAEQANEVQQSDFVGPCYLRGPVRFYSLNSVDVATGRCAVTPQLDKTAQSTIDGFWANWCRLGLPRHQQVDNEMVFYGSPTHPRGMGCVIRLCLAQGIEPWFIPLGEPWRNGVVEKFNDHYQQGLLQRETLSGAEALAPASLAFEEKHNGRYRYSKLQGRTPLQALARQSATLRFPASPESPRHPLPKPETGRYHLVRLIRSDGLLDVFSEKFRAPPEATYAYVTATIEVATQKLQLSMDGTIIDEHHYSLR